MTQVASIKRGDTLSWPASYTDAAGAAIDLTGYTIRSQLRGSDDSLLAELTIADRNNAAGTFRVTAAAAVTAEWSPGSYACDVELESGSGDVRSCNTFVLRVVADVTRAS